MKTIWLVRARDRGNRAAETARAAALIEGAQWPGEAIRISLLSTLHDDETDDAPADLLVECWSELPLSFPSDLAAALRPSCEVRELPIEERVRKDVDGWRPAGVTAGVSLLAFCAPPPGQARHVTLRHWTEHVPLALAVHHGAERYVQNVVLPDAPAEAPWFGIAQLHFPDREGIPGYLFRSEADVELITRDAADFVAASPTVLVGEHVLRA